MINQVRFIEAGHCKQLERFVNPKSGSFKNVRFPSSVAIIEHATQGVVLFDTGYSPRFKEVTRHFPERFYALATPVSIEPEETAVAQLQEMGIQISDVRHVVLSHFHADHVAGAADFTAAQYVFSLEEYRYFKAMSNFGRVKSGFLNALLPTDLEQRMSPLNQTLNMQHSRIVRPIAELGEGWFGTDLFGDESIMLVLLPGHTIGQTGLFVRGPNQQNYFLVADAAWLKASFEENVTPMGIAQFLFHDRKTYAKTLGRIHDVSQKRNSNLNIIPCHCEKILGGLSV